MHYSQMLKDATMDRKHLHTTKITKYDGLIAALSANIESRSCRVGFGAGAKGKSVFGGHGLKTQNMGAQWVFNGLRPLYPKSECKHMLNDLVIYYSMSILSTDCDLIISFKTRSCQILLSQKWFLLELSLN